MIKVGIAGIGFMGWIHYLAYEQIEGVEVVAICENDPSRRNGDWTDIRGNFGPPGRHVDLSNIAVYDDLDAFCQAPFDLIDICLPPAMHVPTIERAARHGKHVFSEKPLALTTAACTAAVDACRTTGSLLMVGHVLPFFPEFRHLREIVDSGIYGPIKSAFFKRVISDPTWLPDFYNPQKIGGPLLDLHVHDAHFIRLLAGMPTAVSSIGHMQGDVVRFCHSVFQFEDQDLAIASSSGVIGQQGRPFTHGFEVQLESATLQFEYAALESGDESMPLKIMTDDGKVTLIETGDGDPVRAFVAEIEEVVSALNAQRSSTILAGDLALDAIKICQAESQSVANRAPCFIV